MYEHVWIYTDPHLLVYEYVGICKYLRIFRDPCTDIHEFVYILVNSCTYW
jgi:hypothetical protein